MFRELSLCDPNFPLGCGFGFRLRRDRRGLLYDLWRLFSVDRILEQRLGWRRFRLGRQAQQGLKRRSGRGNRLALENVREEQDTVHGERQRKSQNQTERH